MFYKGSSSDGTDATQVEGMYISPCGKYFSSEPYTKEQKTFSKKFRFDDKMFNSIIKHLKLKHNTTQNFDKHLKDEYDLILNSASTLSQKRQDWLLDYFNDKNN